MSRVEQLCISALAPELARRGIATQIVDLADTDQRGCDPSASRLKQLLAAPNAVVILGARETFQALVRHPNRPRDPRPPATAHSALPSRIS